MKDPNPVVNDLVEVMAVEDLVPLLLPYMSNDEEQILPEESVTEPTSSDFILPPTEEEPKGPRVTTSVEGSVSRIRFVVTTPVRTSPSPPPRP